jgi:hypothetical protein
MLKRFFYAAAAVLMLALSFQLGAVTVHAQSTGPVECVGYEENAGFAVINHHLIFINNSAPPSYDDLGPLPSAARAVACGLTGVVLEDGTVWQCNGPGLWRQFGTFPFSGSVAAQKSSWGELKARYR